MPSTNDTLGRRIKQQSCSNELTGWMQAPPSAASRSPPQMRPTSSSTTLAPFAPQVHLLLVSPFSSTAVKVGREVQCLSELREHSCLFQTGHPPAPPQHPKQPTSSPAAPTHPGPDKRHLYSSWAWKPLWGLLSLHSYTHSEKKQSVCAPQCGKFVHGKQSMGSFLCWNTHTHTHTQVEK